MTDCIRLCNEAVLRSSNLKMLLLRNLIIPNSYWFTELLDYLKKIKNKQDDIQTLG